MRAPWRLLRVLLHVLGGYLRIRLTFSRLSLAERQGNVQRWAAGFLKLLGVHLRVQGDTQAQSNQGLLLVANHISWLDILVLLAVRPVRFVSKSEVAAWPFIGPMATGAGTLYIERARKRDALRMVGAMQDALAAGHCVGVFPEGTTSDGTTLLPFHANLLQSAVASGTPVLPVAMAFLDGATLRPSQAASYVNDESLAQSVWGMLSQRTPLVAQVQLLPVSPHQADRRAWADALHAQISVAHAEMVNTAP